MKKLCIVFITVLSFVFVGAFLGGCSFSRGSSFGKGKMDIKFDSLTMKEREVRLCKGCNSLTLSYKDFSLQEGEILLCITSSDGTEIFKHIFSPVSESEGNFLITNLQQEGSYRVVLTGNGAKEGRISFSWSSEN